MPNINRRRFVAGSAFAAAFPLTALAQELTTGQFDAMFKSAERNPLILDATKEVREGLADEYEFYLTRTTAPRVTPSDRSISQKAKDLLVLFEVTNKKRYIASKYNNPTWPKGASGVTIGIGYDVGYMKPAWLDEDWGGILPQATINRLKVACGISGISAKALIPSLSDIDVDWDSAEKQYNAIAIPRWVAVTLAALPNANALSDHSLGALVSLVYNRGPSFKKTGDRYVHMRAIRRMMVNKEFSSIPDQIEAMKILWPANGPVAGLRTRRDLEAALFREGLSA